MVLFIIVVSTPVSVDELVLLIARFLPGGSSRSSHRWPSDRASSLLVAFGSRATATGGLWFGRHHRQSPSDQALPPPVVFDSSAAATSVSPDHASPVSSGSSVAALRASSIRVERFFDWLTALRLSARASAARLGESAPHG
jgi:hypothetical protein